METDPKLNKSAYEIIRHKARQLVRGPEFRPSDQEDIEQELLLAILQRWPAFDPARASAATFIARIIENKAASIVRACRAAKRDARRCAPLDSDDTNAVCEFDEDGCRRQRGINVRSAIESMALYLDVASVIARLPDEQRHLCQRLLHESISSIARSSGEHRTSLYRTIHELRQRFADAGLREYL